MKHDPYWLEAANTQWQASRSCKLGRWRELYERSMWRCLFRYVTGLR